MKKILVYIFLLLSPLSAQAFLGENLGLNLYNEIDQGIDKQEDEAYLYEVVGDAGTIKNEINRISLAKGGRECIGGDISIEEFGKIADGDLETLAKKIDQKCWKQNGEEISEQELLKIQREISGIAAYKFEEAQKKTSNIYKTSRIALYLNGSIDDGPFDLIHDMQRIDTVIFQDENTYEGSNLDDNSLLQGRNASRLASATISSNAPGFGGSSGGSTGGSGGDDDDGSSQEPPVDPEYPDGGFCEIPDDTTGLSESALKSIFPSLERSFQPRNFQKRENINTQKSSTNESGGYQPGNDNENWDCSDFYCVTIDYILYNHKLLGSKGNSIQQVISISNEHLRKFAGSALFQWRMSNESFHPDFNIKDLASMFTMNFQVITKPVPVINVSRGGAGNKGAFSKDVLIEKYYNNLGLEYSSRNSLKELVNKDEEIISLINCAELSVTCPGISLEEYNSFADAKVLENKFIEDAIEQVGLYQNNKNFFNNFAQLEGFVNNLDYYGKGLTSTVAKLSKKPEFK